MSDKTVIVKPVKSTKTFVDEIQKSRTDSSTNIKWDRRFANYLDAEDDTSSFFSATTATDSLSRSASASTLQNSSTNWELPTPTSIQPNTVPKKMSYSGRKTKSKPSGREIKDEKTAKKNSESRDGLDATNSDPGDSPLKTYLSMFTKAKRHSPGSVKDGAFDPSICELTADLVEFCMELLYDFARQEEITPEGYVERKFVYEYINMGDWEMIASIEVFYSCLEKAQILDLVIKGFKRSLGLTISSKITEFEIIQMRVLAFLVLYESERIGVKVLETVLMRFSGQNIRRLYFFLCGQLSFDSSLKFSIASLKGEDYFAQLIGPNISTSAKLMKKVPRAMHVKQRNDSLKNLSNSKTSPVEEFPPVTTEIIESSPAESILVEVDTMPPPTPEEIPVEETNFEDIAIEDIPRTSSEETDNFFSPRETADAEFRDTFNSAERPVSETKVEGNLEEKYDYHLKPSTSSISKALKGPSYRGKDTITTLLRERQRLKNLLISDSFGDYESALRSMTEKQKMQDIKTDEAREEERKRKLLLLQSQLAYHKAIAAARNAQEKRQGIGNEIRKEKEIIKLIVEQERLFDLEEKKKQAKLMAEQEMERTRKAAEESLKQKQEIANRIKKDNEELRLQSLKREKEEELQRLDTIKRIQAVHGPKPLVIAANNVYHESLLRKVYNAKNTIRLSISKMEREQNLRNTQRKILECKREKLNKLSVAQNEIDLWRMTNNIKRSMEREIKQPEVFQDSDDDELVKIKKQLEKLKGTNSKPFKSGPTKSEKKLV